MSPKKALKTEKRRKLSGWMGEARSIVQLTRYVSVKRPFSIKLSILRIPSDTPRDNQFRSSSETGVKGFSLLCGLCRGSVLFEQTINIIESFAFSLG